MLTLYLVSFAAVSWDVTQPPPPNPPKKTAAKETTLYRAFSYSNLVAVCVAAKSG